MPTPVVTAALKMAPDWPVCVSMRIQGLISKPMTTASRRNRAKETEGWARVARMAKMRPKLARMQIHMMPPPENGGA